MLRSEERARLTVVLVGARNPQNIGAAARAMRDFGFEDLRVVNTFAPPFEAAQLEAKSAVAADDILRAARLYATLEEAIADCTLVAGTTAIGARHLQQPVQSLQSVTPVLVQALRQAAASSSGASSSSSSTPPQPGVDDKSCIALLFGSEKTGLTVEQLSHCSLLLTIPMYAPEGRHLSMNLGQAVAVCLYELIREGFEGARKLPVLTPQPASEADRQRLLELLLALMQRSAYAHRFPANARPHVVRKLVHALAGDRDVAATWMGILKMVLQNHAERPADLGGTQEI